MSKPKIALLFPGQGAQYVGMGEDLVQNYGVARDVFAAADDALGFSISQLCFNGPEDILTRTENAQPAILTVSLACWTVLEQEGGVQPEAVAGLSLGEYAALVVAQSFDFSTAVRLVHLRGRFMEEAVPAGEGTMAAVLGLSRQEVEAICEQASINGVVEPANYNCPGQVVIAGQVSAVAEAGKMVMAQGGKFKPLKVSGPFHSSLLRPAGERLAKVLAQVDIKAPLIPVVANVTADYVKTGQEVEEFLVRQVSSPVLWEDSMKKLIDDGYNAFIEVGPGKALSGFLKRIDRRMRCFNVEDVSSLEKALAELKGVS
ncbi:MAG: ACP S-malonyltransferase [Firmicutes bacterium]|nr:ACP S-malonyltransferase [Bacillota bacterium]